MPPPGFKIGGQAHAGVADAQAHGLAPLPSGKRLQADANFASVAIRKAVFEAVGNQLVDQQAAGRGLVHADVDDGQPSSFSRTAPKPLAMARKAWVASWRR